MKTVKHPPEVMRLLVDRISEKGARRGVHPSNGVALVDHENWQQDAVEVLLQRQGALFASQRLTAGGTHPMAGTHIECFDVTGTFNGAPAPGTT